MQKGRNDRTRRVLNVREQEERKTVWSEPQESNLAARTKGLPKAVVW